MSTDYKSTIILPRTDFPMRAGLPKREPEILERWAEMDLFSRLRQAAKGREKFILHDGPPYANGHLHMGHALNKILKDVINRSQQMLGKDANYVPGWDCHGLPIEHKVMTELMESGKAAKLDTLSEDDRRMAIRRECKKSASKYIKLQSTQMKRLLTLADYDNPYLTMAPAYEKAVLEVFATMVEQGLVYRALKSVHWSIANETALAEALGRLAGDEQRPPEIEPDHPFHVVLVKLLKRPAANTARGNIHNAPQGFAIRGIDDDPQITKQILDFLAIVEFRAPGDLVTNAGPQECLFDDAGQCVGAVENGNFVQRAARLNVGFDFFHEEVGFILRLFALDDADCRSEVIFRP